MNIFLLTTVVVVVCAGLMALGVIVKGKPLQKRCSADPDDACTCRADSESRCENR